MANYPYLNDRIFLKKFDSERLKEQTIRVSVLDFQTELVIANITGKCTSGSCNLSGTSNMRRTASCSIVVDPEGIRVNGYKELRKYNDITEVENLISINKKVKMEVGFKNTTSSYTDFDKIWFPLGTYVIKNASISKNNSGINISLTLNDKCALLNGDMGGIIPAGTIFSELETFNSKGTQKYVEKILIKEIIKTIVTEFGGEDPNNVIITDIDNYIVKVMKWNGNSKCYLSYPGCVDGPAKDQNKTLTTTKRVVTGEKGETVEVDAVEYEKGDLIGYTLEPFVYPGTLECNAGETVASVLDKIKNALGNFEWFYDINGRFIFQKIKNFMNESVVTDILNESTDIPEDLYLPISTPSKADYVFDETNRHLISSISNAPQYPNIKNDFIIWGTRKGVSGADLPIRYHLAFDNKPIVDESNVRFALVYTDYRGLQSIIPLKNNFQFGIPSQITNKDLFFIDTTWTEVNNTLEYKVFKYDETTKGLQERPEYKVRALITDEWRTELYYYSLWHSGETFSSNPYEAELIAEWPKIWNCTKTQVQGSTATLSGSNKDGSTTQILVTKFKGGYKSGFNKYQLDYWLDFLEGSGSDQGLSKFNIHKIGRRSKVVNDKDVNCIFAESFPPYVYIETSKNTTDKEQEIARQVGREVIQVSSEVFKSLSVGGNQNSAFDKARELLYNHTQYNESINISITPIYYLEPNTRITIVDEDTGVYGNYLIKTISLPLAHNGTSSISATKCIEKTI